MRGHIKIFVNNSHARADVIIGMACASTFPSRLYNRNHHTSQRIVPQDEAHDSYLA